MAMPNTSPFVTAPRQARLVRLACAVALVGLCGASCPQMVRQYKLPIVREQARAMLLDELVLAINENSQRVHSLTSTSATLSGPRFPSLRANIALERPRHFRLIAEKTGLSGTELDLGSNDELFWFWVKRSEPPALYFCRHDQFGASAARRVVPVEPEWLIEALGLVVLDREQITSGPAVVGRGRVRLELSLARPEGAWRKVLMVDQGNATVIEQHVYDEQGRLMASALLSRYQREPASGAMLPEEIEIEWPPIQLAMKIQLRDVKANQIAGDPAQLWTKPEYRGWANVDLADPNLRLPGAPVEQMSSLPGGQPLPRQPRLFGRP
jgi:hypothetical protein